MEDELFLVKYQINKTVHERTLQDMSPKIL